MRSLYGIAQENVSATTSSVLISNWVATDGAGRTLPVYSDTGPYKPNKYVGIFYFLWHGQYNDKDVYDISVLTRKNREQPNFGPESTWHWWGEPEAGYFKSDDPWVIRRNLQLLSVAGVDVLFLDATNADAYLPVVNKLCEISAQMRREGLVTPYICFVTYTRSKETIETIYQQFYVKNLYSELWFRWQGKPLILGKVEEASDPTIRDFFTWRYSWAWTNTRNEPRHWQWLDRTPQNYGWDTDPSIPEQIPVAVASHPYDNNIGKSYRQGKHTTLNAQGTTASTQLGLYFDEQWKRALTVDPTIVFVAGWNEWVAQRLVNKSKDTDSDKPTSFMGKALKPRQSFFIDLYNEEYNRDIEPMKGGYTDNYYYQLVANVRRFKGMPTPEKASLPRTIQIDGRFDEWHSVKPEYFDPVGDVLHRNWPRSDGKVRYVNKTGRNDIRLTKVAHDQKTVFFYARTAQKLTPATDKNWMLLYIDTDQSSKTGFAGYDFLVNQRVHGNQSAVSQWVGKKWVQVSTASLRYNQHEVEISVPNTILKESPSNVQFDFHWADNVQKTDQINEFFINGDSAPDRRFNYRYKN